MFIYNFYDNSTNPILTGNFKIRNYVLIYSDYTHGIMVIIEEVESVIWVQILNKGICISFSANTLRKGINPIIEYKPGEEWVLPDYSCPRQVTLVVPHPKPNLQDQWKRFQLISTCFLIHSLCLNHCIFYCVIREFWNLTFYLIHRNNLF